MDTLVSKLIISYWTIQNIYFQNSLDKNNQCWEYAKFILTYRVHFMAIAYDFPYDLSVTEISASAYGDDIKAAHKIDHINHNLTVIKCEIIYNILITKLGLVERGTNESGEDVINSLSVTNKTSFNND